MIFIILLFADLPKEFSFFRLLILEGIYLNWYQT
jgi:hypothetical protein